MIISAFLLGSLTLLNSVLYHKNCRDEIEDYQKGLQKVQVFILHKKLEHAKQLLSQLHSNELNYVLCFRSKYTLPLIEKRQQLQSQLGITLPREESKENQDESFFMRNLGSISLLVGGYTLLGLTYATLLIVSSLGLVLSPSPIWISGFFPVIGTFILGGSALASNGIGYFVVGILSMLWGAMQLAGLGMVIAGHIYLSKAKQKLTSNEFQPQNRVKWAVLPWFSGDGIGAVVVGSF